MTDHTPGPWEYSDRSYPGQAAKIAELEAEKVELIAIIEKLMKACEALDDAPDGYINACFVTAQARGEW